MKPNEPNEFNEINQVLYKIGNDHNRERAMWNSGFYVGLFCASAGLIVVRLLQVLAAGLQLLATGH